MDFRGKVVDRGGDGGDGESVNVGKSGKYVYAKT